MYHFCLLKMQTEKKMHLVSADKKCSCLQWHRMGFEAGGIGPPPYKTFFFCVYVLPWGAGSIYRVLSFFRSGKHFTC